MFYALQFCAVKENIAVKYKLIDYRNWRTVLPQASGWVAARIWRPGPGRGSHTGGSPLDSLC